MNPLSFNYLHDMKKSLLMPCLNRYKRQINLVEWLRFFCPISRPLLGCIDMVGVINSWTFVGGLVMSMPGVTVAIVWKMIEAILTINIEMVDYSCSCWILFLLIGQSDWTNIGYKGHNMKETITLIWAVKTSRLWGLFSMHCVMFAWPVSQTENKVCNMMWKVLNEINFQWILVLIAVSESNIHSL